MLKVDVMILIILIAIVSVNISLNAQETKTRVVATGLEVPWELIWGPDDFIWITERPGRIQKINPSTGEKILLLDITDKVQDGVERGLMGMVLHPDFVNSPLVYIVFTYNSNQGTQVKVERYTYNENDNVLIFPLTIFDNIPGNSTHDGARLMIDEDMTLYLTMGDARLGGGQQLGDLAQDLSSLNGKTLRMNLDGSVPQDNPFVDDPEANPYVWSWGHRNQQGMVKANGILYTSEHGANIADELNIVVKGRNYGWPNVEGICNTPAEILFCNENDIVEPIGEYNSNSTLALCGIDYYNHNLISAWNHSILMVGLARQVLVQVKLSENGQSVEENNLYYQWQFGRLRDVCVSPDGRVFICTSERDGRGSPNEDDDQIIEISPVVSTDGENRMKFQAYPNPSNGNFRFTGFEESVTIYDQFGNKIKSVSNNWMGTDSENRFLPPGVYFARSNYQLLKLIKN